MTMSYIWQQVTKQWLKQGPRAGLLMKTTRPARQARARIGAARGPDFLPPGWSCSRVATRQWEWIKPNQTESKRKKKRGKYLTLEKGDVKRAVCFAGQCRGRFGPELFGLLNQRGRRSDIANKIWTEFDLRS